MEVKYWYITLLVQAKVHCSLQDNYTLLHGSDIWTDHVGKCPCLEKYTPQHEEDIFVIYAHGEISLMTSMNFSWSLPRREWQRKPELGAGRQERES